MPASSPSTADVDCSPLAVDMVLELVAGPEHHAPTAAEVLVAEQHTGDRTEVLVVE